MKLREQLDQFFFDSCDTRTLAVFRWATGLFMLIHQISALGYWEQAYGPSGMAADSQGKFLEFNWFSILDQTQNSMSVGSWWWIQLVVILLWTIGLGGRPMSFALYVLITSVYYRNYMYSNAEQCIWRVAAFFSIFLPLNDHFSADAWIRKKMNWPSPPPRRRWVLRIFQLYLCSLYYVSSPWKWFADEVWRNGDAMYYVAINDTWGRLPFAGLFYYGWISKISTWASLIIEWVFSILVFIPRFRKWITLDLIVLHILIAVFLNNVTYFSLSTATCLMTFFEWNDLVEIKNTFRQWHWPTSLEFLEARRKNLRDLLKAIDDGGEAASKFILATFNISALLATFVVFYALIKKVYPWPSETGWSAFAEFVVWMGGITLLWSMTELVLPNYRKVARVFAWIFVTIALLRYGHLVIMGWIDQKTVPVRPYAAFSALLPLVLWILLTWSERSQRLLTDPRSRNLLRWITATTLLLSAGTSALILS